MNFLDRLNSNWDEEKANNKILTGISKITGERMYVHYDGSPIDESECNHPFIHFISDNISIEDYAARYKAVCQNLQNLIERVRSGEVWEPEVNDISGVVRVKIKYPNGKKGDIDLFVVEESGKIINHEELWYEALIPVSEKEALAQLMSIYDVRHRLISEINDRDELSQFLNTYNLFHKLRQLCDEFYLVGCPQYHPLRNEGRYLAGEYIDGIRKKANEIYAYLVTTGKSTGKWKSEQMAFAIIKKMYPDAIYQYKPDWLGYQSIDIFIPSIMIGIEYQGYQHYYPVDFFGGIDGLAHRKHLDKVKREKCAEHGISLIDWKYNDPITETHIRNLIQKTLTSRTS